MTKVVFTVFLLLFFFSIAEGKNWVKVNEDKTATVFIDNDRIIQEGIFDDYRVWAKWVFKNPINSAVFGKTTMKSYFYEVNCRKRSLAEMQNTTFFTIAEPQTYTYLSPKVEYPIPDSSKEKILNYVCKKEGSKK